MSKNSPNEMSPKEFRDRMKEISDQFGKEESHIKADRLVAKVLDQHGYNEGIDIYRNMGKWYA